MLQEAAKQWRCWGLSSAWTAYWCAGLSLTPSSLTATHPLPNICGKTLPTSNIILTCGISKRVEYF